jgi:uncharacterized damage-inducible protein DinB
VTTVPPENFARPLSGDTRTRLPLEGDERTILTSFLDWHRETLALKCAGLSTEELSRTAIPPSGLSLHGLLRHLAAVERWWFRVRFAREQVPLLYYSDENPNQDFTGTGGDVSEALATWRAECDLARDIVGRSDLDDTGELQTGEPISLRRILVHMIAEYARHNGHADLLRERIDGSTGY